MSILDTRLDKLATREVFRELRDKVSDPLTAPATDIELAEVLLSDVAVIFIRHLVVCERLRKQAAIPKRFIANPTQEDIMDQCPRCGKDNDNGEYVCDACLHELDAMAERNLSLAGVIAERLEIELSEGQVQ